MNKIDKNIVLDMKIRSTAWFRFYKLYTVRVLDMHNMLMQIINFSETIMNIFLRIFKLSGVV